MDFENMKKIFPLPWKASPPQGMFGWEVIDAKGKLVCQLSRHPAHQKEAGEAAKFIVHLANNS